MSDLAREPNLASLRQAYLERRLTLYLGAGVSVANGLPTWPQLVLAMYFRFLDEKQAARRKKPFANYLFAIAEWHLEHRREPLEITARKVRNLCEDQQEPFIEKLRSVLYEGFKEEPETNIMQPGIDPLLAANPTLAAVLRLCDAREGSSVQSVITYNYDNLVEYVSDWQLPSTNGQPALQAIWRQGDSIAAGSIPVYHVHGYVPMDGTGSSDRELVFTEEQYHAAYQDLYSWSNLVQIQAMTNSVGLMVGLSMTDPNMRRLLDAVRKLPATPENYVLLQRPNWQEPTPSDIQDIDQNALKYKERFDRSGSKSRDAKFLQIPDILQDVRAEDVAQQTAILNELGVQTIWWSDPSEIPAKIDAIIPPRSVQAAV